MVPSRHFILVSCCESFGVLAVRCAPCCASASPQPVSGSNVAAAAGRASLTRRTTTSSKLTARGSMRSAPGLEAQDPRLQASCGAGSRRTLTHPPSRKALPPPRQALRWTSPLQTHRTCCTGFQLAPISGVRIATGVHATPIRTNWPREGLRRLWKQPIGAGYASFVVADGRAFTIEQRRNQEVAAAYDVQTGRELWTNAWNASFEESMGGDGPRATPTYHEGRVYALGAEGELRVLDAAKGTLVWRRNILSDNGAYNLSWGMSAAPLIVDDTVVVLPGGTRGSSVVAYDKGTGAPGVESPERRGVVHLADARDARRRPPDPGRDGDACRGAHTRQGRTSVGIPVEHLQRHQRRAADCLHAQRTRSHLHVRVVRPWRCRVRAVAGRRWSSRRRRSGKTNG